MATNRHRSAEKKRRTTLTLAVDSLTQAERIARSRKVSVSTVISEALSEGLRVHAALQRSDFVLNAFKQAFTGFADAEIATLGGNILEPQANTASDQYRHRSFPFRYQR
jgi:flagellar biosynthesis protein FliR